MKAKRIAAVIAAFALLCGTAPVSPLADMYENTVITASAAETETKWNFDKLWELIAEFSYTKIQIVGSKSETMDIKTNVSISNDDSIYAGLGNGDASDTLYIYAMDSDGKRADQKVKAPNSCSHLFDPAYYTSTLDKETRDKLQTQLQSIDCSGLDTSDVTHMSGMFAHNNALTSLNISGLKTDKVKYMDYMFTSDSALTELDVSGFNTENVINMSWMFAYCGKLTSLDISKFNTQNVTNMSTMFYMCRSLPEIKFGEKFKTDKVTDMSDMFNGDAKLTSIIFGDGFTTSNVTNMHGMFGQCDALTSLDLSSFDTSKVTDMGFMFWIDTNLSSIKFGEKFTTSQVTNMKSIFDALYAIEELDLSMFEINSNANTTDAVLGCSKLKSVKCSKDTFKKLGFSDDVKRTACGVEDYLIEGYSLDIANGCFMLNVYMDLPELNESTAFVRFTLPDSTYKDIPITEAIIKNIEGSSIPYTVFPVELSAKDMNRNVLVDIYKNNDSKMSDQCAVSVKNYAEALKSRNAVYSGFIDAMLNYGAYAEAYFSKETYNPKSYKTSTYGDISQNKITSSGTVTLENYYGSSLLLKNKIILRHYFTKPVTNAVQKGDYWYVEQAFNPTEFDKPISGYGTYTINDYIKKVLSGSNQELKNLCCALYEYNQAALALANIK